jgi:hypothetical protein
MQKFKEYLFSFFCFLLVAITVVVFLYFRGYPNEFVYNIPSIKSVSEGLIYPEAIITYSRQFTETLFFKYLFKFLLNFSSNLIFIYLCYSLINIAIFWIGGIVLYKDKILGSLYLLVFFLLSGKIIISGIPSSYYYSILILGFALFLRGYKKLHYFVAIASYFIYPIASMLILAASCLGFFLRKDNRYAFVSIFIASSMVITAKLTGYQIALDDYYTSYLGWPKILADDYFFSDSMILIGKSREYLDIFLSVFFDANKIGTTLLSLRPFETPRFVAFFIIPIALYLSRMSLIKKYSYFRAFLIALTCIYVVAFIFSFHFYYPNRYVIGPLFLFIACLCFDSLRFVYNYSKKYFIGIMTISGIALSFFYFWHPVGGTPVNLNNYLSYQSQNRGESFDKLRSRLSTEKNKVIAASPRLSEMLLITDVPVVPMITYKFIDKTTPLKEAGKKFWKLYLAESRNELKRQCLLSKVDYIIFEEKLLNL